MDLPAYIRSLAPGVTEAINAAAQLFEAEPGTVKAWLYRERYPRPEMGQKIVQRTKGKVSFAGIYGERRA